MRFTRPKPCTINTVGEDTAATVQFGYPTHLSDGDTTGALLFMFTVPPDPSDPGTTAVEVDVKIPVDLLHDLLDAHGREEQR